MKPLDLNGACDCHSHVFGPFREFPLAPERTFDPPEAPVAELESVWNSLGIERAVLVQGSAHGTNPNALLTAIQRAPHDRRGVVLLDESIDGTDLARLHAGGIRAVRFNWISHLLRKDSRSEIERLAQASQLLERIVSFGWHAEFHIDIQDIHLLQRLERPTGMPFVVDHMARIDMASPDADKLMEVLLGTLENPSNWVKVSGADRLAASCRDLRVSLAPMTRVLQAAPSRCVWGLDWPHVNLARRRTDAELLQILQEAAGDVGLRKVLVENPTCLYQFAHEAA